MKKFINQIATRNFTITFIYFVCMLFFGTNLSAQGTRCGYYSVTYHTAEIAGKISATWTELEWIDADCAAQAPRADAMDSGGNNDGGGGVGDDSDGGRLVFVSFNTIRNPTPPNELWNTTNINIAVAMVSGALVGPSTIYIAGALGAEISMLEFYAWATGVGWGLTSGINFYHAVLNWQYDAQIRVTYQDSTTGSYEYRYGDLVNVSHPVKSVLKAECGSSTWYTTVIDNTGIYKWW